MPLILYFIQIFKHTCLLLKFTYFYLIYSIYKTNKIFCHKQHYSKLYLVPSAYSSAPGRWHGRSPEIRQWNGISSQNKEPYSFQALAQPKETHWQCSAPGAALWQRVLFSVSCIRLGFLPADSEVRSQFSAGISDSVCDFSDWDKTLLIMWCPSHKDEQPWGSCLLRKCQPKTIMVKNPEQSRYIQAPLLS